MPSSSHHVNQAANNIKFLKTFYSTYIHNDWAITVGFYTAVHIVEGALYETKKITIKGKEIDVEGAEGIKRELIKNGITLPSINLSTHKLRILAVGYAFPDISSYYKNLHDMAWQARYIKFSWTQPETYLAVEFDLKPIIEWYNGKLKKSLDFDFKVKKPQDPIPSKGS